MFDRLFRWLLPSVCPGCGLDLAEGGPVCSGCWLSLEKASPAPLPEGMDRCLALAAFAPPLREIVLAFKYRGRGYLGSALAGWMSGRLPAWVSQSDVIVPVPSPALRRIARGYHPAETIAGGIAEALELPMNRGALRRRHGFPSQTSLDRKSRGLNAARSFARGSRIEKTRGMRVLLVDDVSTTGATLSACARLLREAGAASINGLVLAQEALHSHS